MKVAEPVHDPSYERRAVTLLLFGFGLVGLDRWVIAPLFPFIVRDLHVNYQDLGTAIGVLGVAWGVSAMFMGSLSDRIGRRKVLVGAMLIFSLLSVITGMATGIVTLILARGIMGVSEGAFCPTSFAATAEASLPTRRGFNQGLQQSSFALFGLGIGPILATQLVAVMSWRWVFMIVGLPGLILSYLIARTIRENRHMIRHASGKTSAPHMTVRDLFAHRNVALSMFALLFAMMGIFVLSSMTPSYLTDHLGLSGRQMGFVTSAIGFGGFLGQWGLAGFSDLLGRRSMAILGFIGGAIFIALFAAAGPNPILLFVLLFLGTGIAFGLLSLITGPMASEAAPPGRGASVAGMIMGPAEIFGGGIAPFAAGFIAQRFGIQYTLYVAIAGLLVGAVVSLFFLETAPRRTTQTSTAVAED